MSRFGTVRAAACGTLLVSAVNMSRGAAAADDNAAGRSLAAAGELSDGDRMVPIVLRSTTGSDAAATAPERYLHEGYYGEAE